MLYDIMISLQLSLCSFPTFLLVSIAADFYSLFHTGAPSAEEHVQPSYIQHKLLRTMFLFFISDVPCRHNSVIG